MKPRIVLLAGLVVLVGSGAACTGGEGPSAPGAATEAATTTSSVGGRVESADGPVAGATVTARIGGSGIEVSVFTRSDGTFDLPVDAGEALGLVVRAPGYDEARIAPADLVPPVAVELRRSDNPHASAPSTYWLSLLPEGEMKKEFILNCATCHEIGHPRVMVGDAPRTTELWQAAFALMRAIDAYAVLPPDMDDAAYSEWLAEHLSAERLAEIPPPPPVAESVAAELVVTEYPLPYEDSLPHDLVIGPDGRVWVTAFFYDKMWALDPDTGEIETLDVDTDPEINDQPRALEFDANGQLWIVNGGTEKVLRLDIESGEYAAFDVDMYAHSLDLDSNGDVWINDYFSKPERIARVSNPDGEVTILPVPSANLTAAEGLPLPYGLQIDPKNRLWSTQLAANTLIRYDIESGESKLYEMPEPNAGPRRPGVGPDGMLWIPEFNTGHLTRFDGDTETFERIRLGPSSLGAYDVEVNQQTGEVWVTGSMDSSLIKYDPKTGEVTRYPFPTEPGYTRHIAIDPKTGDVWSAYSSLPAAIPKVVRLQFRD